MTWTKVIFQECNFPYLTIYRPEKKINNRERDKERYFSHTPLSLDISVAWAFEVMVSRRSTRDSRLFLPIGSSVKWVSCMDYTVILCLVLRRKSSISASRVDGGGLWSFSHVHLWNSTAVLSRALPRLSPIMVDQTEHWFPHSLHAPLLSPCWDFWFWYIENCWLVISYSFYTTWKRLTQMWGLKFQTFLSRSIFNNELDDWLVT